MTRSARSLVVADAGPLIGLAKTGRLDLLRRLFRTILVPEAVAAELRLESTLPGAAALTAARDEGWLQIVAVGDVPDRLSAAVDRGEAEAIVLASARNALLLIDDLPGRTAARSEGVRIFGTAAVLLRAKERGFIPAVRPALEALQAAHYRLSPALLREVLRLAGEKA